MELLSNDVVFPALQIAIVIVLIYVIYRDRSPIPSPGAIAHAEVVRGDQSMKRLERTTGLVLALIITLINKSVFDADPHWAAYAAFFNVLDVGAILVCLLHLKLGTKPNICDIGAVEN